MHVASLELCKELYELSGWQDTEKCHTNYEYAGENGKLRRDRWEVKVSRTARDGRLIIPAYDLGYLLRKLKTVRNVVQVDITLNVAGGWNARVIHVTNMGENQHYYQADADIPEDAACKLAIELFKQGILKREVTV